MARCAPFGLAGRPALDGFPPASVRSRHVGGGGIISQSRASGFDFERLERAVEGLAAKHERVHAENGSLRRELDDRERRIRTLEGQLLEANQRRKDVAKRVDELITQLDFLDSQLAESKP